MTSAQTVGRPPIEPGTKNLHKPTNAFSQFFQTSLSKVSRLFFSATSLLHKSPSLSPLSNAQLSTCVASTITPLHFSFWTQIDRAGKGKIERIVDLFLVPIRTFWGQRIKVIDMSKTTFRLTLMRTTCKAFIVAIRITLLIPSSLIGGMGWLCIRMSQTIIKQHVEIFQTFSQRTEIVEEDITDAQLKVLAHYCKKIEKLSLFGKASFSVKGLKVFKDHPELKYVELPGKLKEHEAVLSTTLPNVESWSFI